MCDCQATAAHPSWTDLAAQPVSPSFGAAVSGFAQLLLTTLRVIYGRRSYLPSLAWAPWLAQLETTVEDGAAALGQPGVSVDAALRVLARMGEEFGRAWHGLIKSPVDVSRPAATQAGTTPSLLVLMTQAVMTVVKWGWRSQGATSHANWARGMERLASNTYTWITKEILPRTCAPLELELGVMLARLTIAVHRVALLLGTTAPMQLDFGAGDCTSASHPAATDTDTTCPTLAWKCDISVSTIEGAARTTYGRLQDLVAPAPLCATTATTLAVDPMSVSVLGAGHEEDRRNEEAACVSLVLLASSAPARPLEGELATPKQVRLLRQVLRLWLCNVDYSMCSCC